MKKKAIKYNSKYFGISEKVASELNHLTIDCMTKFAQEEVNIIKKQSK